MHCAEDLDNTQGVGGGGYHFLSHVPCLIKVTTMCHVPEPIISVWPQKFKLYSPVIWFICQEYGVMNAATYIITLTCI
jgi:hypothetical protein